MASTLRSHRCLLEDLYIVQDLTLEEIRKFMRSEHSINAGRSSYERLFKEWGLRKTNKGENWNWVSHKVQKRQNDGRKSALYIRGKHIPIETRQKEISRHVSTRQQALHRSKTASSPRTPDGYVIATPASSGAVGTPSQAATPNGYDSLPTTSPGELVDIDVIVSPEANARETDLVENDEPEIDFRDKTMIVETLQSCGTFIKAWGSSGRSLSSQKVLDMYLPIANGISTSCEIPEEHAVQAEATYFTTGFNILLSTYQGDVESVQAAMNMPDFAKYKDVFHASLFFAARKGILDIVKILFSSFATDLKDNDGQTCLHISSIYNQPHVVEFLIGWGVDVHIRRRDGRTAWATISGSPSHEAVSKLLIQAGAQVNDNRPTDEMNCLYQAAAGGKIEEVRTLIQRGASPSYSTPYLWAPLHFAATLEIIQALVEAGADVNALSDTKETPLDMHFQNHAKKECLLAHGAKTARELSQSLARNEQPDLGLAQRQTSDFMPPLAW
ncbi:hypothetical protein QQS21_000165 [Conoideocrella luteorostrata]|uniref:Clr5 domain-containing protein n=1 Tax=Conoideocrella luteorostrata TaxID=1105319 RepID=A0AAJ0CZF9_9HYPO|nr:hypothetical protein QQS21_000165 [Conoideocrella luteorostrata]